MARIKTVDDQVVGCLNQHTHLPRPEAVQAAKVRGNMKDRAITTMEKTRDIINGAAAEQNDQVLAFFTYRKMCIKKFKLMISLHCILTIKYFVIISE